MKIVEEGKTRAREILEKYRAALDAISKKLAEVETLERDEYEALLKAEGVPINDIYKKQRDEDAKAGDPSSAVV
jgi:hypothetical protein